MPSEHANAIEYNNAIVDARQRATAGVPFDWYDRVAATFDAHVIGALTSLLSRPRSEDVKADVMGAADRAYTAARAELDRLSR